MLNKLVIITVIVVTILCSLLAVVGVLRFGKFIVNFALSKRGASLDKYICFSWPGEKMTHRKPG